MARGGQDVPAPLAWVLVAELEALADQGAAWLRHDAPATRQSLTAYPAPRQAVKALFS
jgi:hypothetical protein